MMGPLYSVPINETQAFMRKHALIALLVGIAVFYLAALNDRWAVCADSALYLGLGRSLAEGRGMEFNGEQTWGIPPLVPLLIAACYRLTGTHFWLINLVMSLLGLGTVLVSYATAKRLTAALAPELRAGLPLGVLLAVGFSARLFIESTNILTDVPFAFLVALALYAFVRGREGHWAWFLAGSFAMVAATLTRLLGLVFFGGLVLATALDFRRGGYTRRILASVGGAVLVVGAFLVWLILLRSRSDPGTIDYVHDAGGIAGQFWSWAKLESLDEAAGNFPSALCSSIVSQKLPYLNLVPTAILLCGAWTLARARQLLALVPVGLYVALLAVVAPSAVAPRYFLPIMPVLVYGLLVGVRTLAMWTTRRKQVRTLSADTVATRPGTPRGDAGWALSVAIALCLAISLPKIGRQVYWMRHPRFLVLYEHGRWQGSVEVGNYLAQHGRAETDRVLTPDERVVHYLSRLRALSQYSPKMANPQYYDSAPPEELARVAVDGNYRFVVVPTDKQPWSADAMERLEATGLFGAVKQFADLALYQRATKP